MRKHLIAILIILLVLTLIGTGVWLVVSYNKTKPLYQSHCDFILDEDTNDLSTKMAQAQTLYTSLFSSETRVATLHTIVEKIDTFEKDLNTYLILHASNSKTSKKLSKNYSTLSSKRATLIKNYNEYITRMSGDINAEGPMVQNLYNDLFDKTVTYLISYNKYFISTSNYVFNKVYKAESIKPELYSLYSAGVSDLLNNISNHNFDSTILINRLNNGIKLSNNNIFIKNTIVGGEFGTNAIKFQQYFNNSNLENLVKNFNTYYGLTISPITETSNEKLAVYYAKTILEI